MLQKNSSILFVYILSLVCAILLLYRAQYNTNLISFIRIVSLVGTFCCNVQNIHPCFFFLVFLFLIDKFLLSDILYKRISSHTFLGRLCCCCFLFASFILRHILHLHSCRCVVKKSRGVNMYPYPASHPRTTLVSTENLHPFHQIMHLFLSSGLAPLPVFPPVISPIFWNPSTFATHHYEEL